MRGRTKEYITFRIYLRSTKTGDLKGDVEVDGKKNRSPYFMAALQTLVDEHLITIKKKPCFRQPDQGDEQDGN